MSDAKINKRLNRLKKFEGCLPENASIHMKELKGLGEESRDKEVLKKRSKFFKAFADETRLRILRLLGTREMCVCEVMVALDLTQPTASHHLGLLENVGLVTSRKDGKWVFYKISEPNVVNLLLDIKIAQ